MDIAEHAGLLLVCARRRPAHVERSAEALTAPRTWLRARAGPSYAADSGAGLVEWL